jgi:hypothetical protein
MPLSWSDAAQAQIAGGAIRPAVFLRVAAMSSPLRMWAGIGDFAVAVDNIETTDQARYAGFGELADFGGVELLVNAKATRAEFKIAGTVVTAEIAALASLGAADIRGAEVNLGLMVLDAYLQPASPIAWMWQGSSDSLSVAMQGDGQGGFTRVLSLSAGSVFTGRRRPRNSFWTDPDQKARSATDDFCALVSNYNIGTTKTWPI